MKFVETMHAAFKDELEKIAAVRAGRRPFNVDTLVKAGKLVKKGVMTKISALRPSSIKPLLIAGGVGAAGGALATHEGKKAVDDFKTGRALRKAQAQGQY